MSLHDQSYTPNYLLATMSAADFKRLQPHLTRVDLAQGACLVAAAQPIEFVYFPEGGVASIVTDMAGDEIEAGLFGRDGMSGTAVLLGSDTTLDKTFVQIDGATALRMPAAALVMAVRESEALRDHLLRFVHVLRLQTTRTAASNARLEVRQRLARWLLMCHDRVDGDMLALTHEFIAMMLATRRAGVTVALHS
ncbi:MAG: Crp/Fnr family transcriptional regulator, partial [Pseudomonadota bacterium]|nr:Crp/Fnr family transcriptional regulator [Pseudomonadota bacterium]